MKRTFLIVVAATTLLAGERTAQAMESSLGVGLGYVKAKQVDATLWFTGDFRFHLNRLFALAPEFGYWKKSATALGVSASVEDLQFGVNAVAVVRPVRGLELFGGGGGTLHYFTGNFAAEGAAASSSSTKGGFDVLGGIDVKAADELSFFLAARYDWVKGLTGANPDRLDQRKFYGGFRLRF